MPSCSVPVSIFGDFFSFDTKSMPFRPSVSVFIIILLSIDVDGSVDFVRFVNDAVATLCLFTAFSFELFIDSGVSHEFPVFNEAFGCVSSKPLICQ